MALVFPTLRLLVLLLNVYMTFKAMKPPPKSQRSARNKLAPSGKAMQYRKRELKSCLAVWVVWSFFSTAEGVFDHTLGLVTPFYSELKCLALLFLLLARAPGAEAIFLHVIHPLLRPYVPAIDDALANIHSIIDLFLLLLSLPLEYVSYWWYGWEGGEDGPPSHDGGRGRGQELRQERMVLRPRSIGNRGEQYQAALQHTSNPQNNISSHDEHPHSHKSNTAKEGPPPTVRLRTRKNILEYPPVEEQNRGPGSRTTGMHYIYGAALNELPPAPSLPPFPILPAAPTANPNTSSHQRRPSVDHSYKIWHPPRSAFVEDGTPPPRDISLPSDRRMPAAYPFSPRFSDPLPPPPFIINPPQLATPTPRRVSTGTPSSHQVFEGTARPSGQTRQSGPSRNARSAEPQGTRREEYFFGQALEPSIQSAEIEMDTETPLVRGDSGADDENAELTGGALGTELSEIARGGRRVTRSSARGDKEGQRKLSMTAEQLQRGLPKNVNESLNSGTDEFGFTIRHPSQTSDRVSTADSSKLGASKAGPSKKPLARTKPELEEDGGDDESPDEKSRKKRQRSTLSADATADDGKHSRQSELGSSPLSGRGGVRRRGKRRTAVGGTDEWKYPDQMRVVHNHATRASARFTAEGERSHRGGATRRGKGAKI